MTKMRSARYLGDDLDAKFGTLPLGAVFHQGGVHFGVYSKHAEQLDCCLIQQFDGEWVETRYAMQRDSRDVWHVWVPNLIAGTTYGFRASGPWNPREGHWFNPRHLLCDPYAKAIVGSRHEGELIVSIDVDGQPAQQDSLAEAFLSVVVHDAFDWQQVEKPRHAWADTIIYEMHVKGFTQLQENLESSKRGKYLGLADPQSIAYLQKLGVTAVQLLPVHHHLHEKFLTRKQLHNYWGYSTMGFFAPHAEYATAGEAFRAVHEFKTMVRELHRAGIEVILDVVFNHSCEGGEQGVTTHFRGLDNASYYLLGSEGQYIDYTGTGNTLDFRNDVVIRMVLDSLRYWVTEMQVDGFRFDLGVTLGRNADQFDAQAWFFKAVQQDPVLRGVKLIAEPWDLGPDGYQVGQFPQPWRELNGKYRDTVRQFWRSDSGITAEFAKRICGSQDIYLPSLRGPLTSVNLITSHDGFTLRDLWSYEHKHNLQNGEDNRDGDNQNHSYNFGVEGDHEDLLERRLACARAMLATVQLSLGVPFLTAGDERWRTQRGNNNAYAQDNEISWMNWQVSPESTALTEWTRRLIALRKRLQFLRREDYYEGVVDVQWWNVWGAAMQHEDWHHPETKFFAGTFTSYVKQCDHLLICNGGDVPVAFSGPAGNWQVLVNTHNGFCVDSIEVPLPHEWPLMVPERSLILLRAENCSETL